MEHELYTEVKKTVEIYRDFQEKELSSTQETINMHRQYLDSQIDMLELLIKKYKLWHPSAN